jgi:putative heme-binding domain-containing protein
MIAGVDLRRGQFKTAVSDQDLTRVLATGTPAAGMPAFAAFQPSEVSGIIAFIRAGFDATATAVKVGDPARGQALFAGKGGCGTCHRVNGRGPRVVSDLSDIGAIRMPGSLQRSLLDPTGSLLPANRTVRAVTRDGRTIRGRRLNEDTYTLQLIDEQERVVSLTKADIRSFEASKESAMPSYARTLTTDEASDVIAYLLSLKGVQP